VCPPAGEGRHRPGDPEPVLGHARLQLLDPLGPVDVVDLLQHDITDQNAAALSAVQRDSIVVEAEGLPDRPWHDQRSLILTNDRPA
jgi:hypothetical protein